MYTCIFSLSTLSTWEIKICERNRAHIRLEADALTERKDSSIRLVVLILVQS